MEEEEAKQPFSTEIEKSALSPDLTLFRRMASSCLNKEKNHGLLRELPATSEPQKRFTKSWWIPKCTN